MGAYATSPPRLFLNPRHAFTARQLLSPLEQTARLCGMRYLAPFVIHNAHAMSEADIEPHALEYRDTLIALRDGTIDLDAVMDLPRLNGRRSCDVDDETTAPATTEGS